MGPFRDYGFFLLNWFCDRKFGIGFFFSRKLILTLSDFKGRKNCLSVSPPFNLVQSFRLSIARGGIFLFHPKYGHDLVSQFAVDKEKKLWKAAFSHEEMLIIDAKIEGSPKGEKVSSSRSPVWKCVAEAFTQKLLVISFFFYSGYFLRGPYRRFLRLCFSWVKKNGKKRELSLKSPGFLSVRKKKKFHAKFWWLILLSPLLFQVWITSRPREI